MHNSGNSWYSLLYWRKNLGLLLRDLGRAYRFITQVARCCQTFKVKVVNLQEDRHSSWALVAYLWSLTRIHNDDYSDDPREIRRRFLNQTSRFALRSKIFTLISCKSTSFLLDLAYENEQSSSMWKKSLGHWHINCGRRQVCNFK